MFSLFNFMSEKFEDTKGSIRSPKSKKDRKHNDHEKWQNNDLQNTNTES